MEITQKKFWQEITKKEAVSCAQGLRKVWIYSSSLEHAMIILLH